VLLAEQQSLDAPEVGVGAAVAVGVAVAVAVAPGVGDTVAVGRGPAKSWLASAMETARATRTHESFDTRFMSSPAAVVGQPVDGCRLAAHA
jgi:hypothetical protein